MGAMQRADTLPPGKQQVLLETSLQNAVGHDLGEGPRISWPYLAVHYRRGLTERTEWSVGASLLSLKAGLKVRVNDPLNEHFAVSVAPEVGGAAFGQENNRDGILAVALPVLLGWQVDPGVQWVIGPRVQYLRTFLSATSTAKPFDIFAVGSSLGVTIPLSENFGMMPEVSVLSPIGRDRFELFDRVSPKIGGTDGVLLQIGVGLLWGGFSTSKAAKPAH